MQIRLSATIAACFLIQGNAFALPAAPAMPAAWDLNLPLQPEPVSGGK